LGDIQDANEEAELNKRLEAFGENEEADAAWRLSRNYEDNLRRQLGGALPGVVPDARRCRQAIPREAHRRRRLRFDPDAGRRDPRLARRS